MSRAVAVVALGSAGDVHPNVGLALALRRRGNRVVLVTCQYFEPLARRVGLEFVGLGTEEDYLAGVRDPYPTIAQGLAGGVPQLVVPLAHDQSDNAIRVRGLGVGEMLLPKHYQVETVLRRLDEMRGSAAIRETCRRRSRDLSADSALERTCELIEGLGR